MRDAVAAAVVRTVYMFFKHYAQAQSEKTAGEIKEVMLVYNASVQDDKWDHNEHHKLFLDCAKPHMGSSLECSLKALGYVSGMTDNVIMACHEKAFNVFR